MHCDTFSSNYTYRRRRRKKRVFFKSLGLPLKKKKTFKATPSISRVPAGSTMRTDNASLSIQTALSPLSMRVQPPSFVTNSPCTYHQLFGIFQQNGAASAAAVNKSIYNQDSSIGVFSLYSFWVCFWLSSIRKSIIECTFKECTNRCVCVSSRAICTV